MCLALNSHLCHWTLGRSGLLCDGFSLIQERFECFKDKGKLRTYCTNIYSVDGGDYVQKESRKSLTSKFLKIQGLLLFSNTDGSLSVLFNISPFKPKDYVCNIFPHCVLA